MFSRDRSLVAQLSQGEANWRSSDERIGHMLHLQMMIKNSSPTQANDGEWPDVVEDEEQLGAFAWLPET